jgi:heat-inducible transcriptional repressor
MELVSLQGSLVLLILVLQGAKVKEQLIIFDQIMSEPELIVMANKLSDTYAGLTGSQILAKSTALSSAEQQITDCLVKVMGAEDNREYEEPYLDGLHFILNQPEFAHTERVQTLVELVENRKLLEVIAPAELSQHTVHVIIGKENKEKAIQNCSVVISQ